MNSKVIEVHNLKRTYETKKNFWTRKRTKVEAVRGIDFEVKKGEIFGLLGENGAGKTTTIKMMITLLTPTSGECKVLGYDTAREERQVRKRINFIFGGEMGVYRRLSARDNLRYFANLYKIPQEQKEQRINELLELVGLTDAADRLVETYSKGMTQRVQIARGLINNPEIIFMDEPTVGLDPVGAQMLRDIIRKLKAEGRTIVLTTHYMFEADELCDQIAIMKKGRIIAKGTSEELKKSVEERLVKKVEDITLEEVYLELMKEKEMIGVNSSETEDGEVA